MLWSGRGGWPLPTPPYGQPDRKISGFFFDDFPYQSLLKSLLAFLLREVFELAHVNVRNWYLTCVLVGTCLWSNWNFVSLDQCGKIAPCHTLFFIFSGFLVKYIWRGQIWQQQNKYCNRLVGIPWRSAPNWWFIPANFGCIYCSLSTWVHDWCVRV